MTPYHEDEWLTVFAGDCREVMAAMPAESVQTVVTSPPYFGLRDYGLPPAVWSDPSDPAQHVHEFGGEIVAGKAGWEGKTRWNHATNGQGLEYEIEDRRVKPSLGAFCECGAWAGTLGLEPSPELYVEHVVEVFRAVRRVLRPDGVVWLNLGDTYADRANRRSDGESFRADRKDVVPGKRNTLGGDWRLKAKDRMLMPSRVAIALQLDGWWVRDEIVWHKPNPMPSSVEDRTTPAHEMVYLLTKRARYYYDADAIREPGTTTRPELLEFGPRPDRGHPGHSNDRRREKVPGGWDVTKGEGGHGSVHRKGRTAATYRDKTAVDPNARGLRQAPEPGEPNAFHPLGRNKRSVWTIATQPYPDAHFATFPEPLVEPCVKAGSRPGDVVLDPFGGSGTVAMVANRLQRKAVHVDLSAEYIDQAMKRIGEDRAAGAGPAIDMPVPFAADGLWAEAAS